MRKLFFVMTFLAALPMLHAQDISDALREGDIVTLGSPTGLNYRYLNFPKRNIIIKRGAIPNFKAIIDKKLIVERIETNKKGKTLAILKRKDGMNFFRFYPTMAAEISRALETGEIKL